MKLQKIKAGFTLIELLVVITIIGILSTWATTVYTSQIQKARDTTRITDVKAVQSWIEQFYQDNAEYPNTTEESFTWVIVYTPKLPSDPKTTQATENSVFDYLYNVSEDDNGIDRQQYEVSTTFEQTWNITNKAATDGWDDDYRLEVWIHLDDSEQKTEVDLDSGIASSVELYACISPSWTDSAAWTDWCGDDKSMLIRNQN